ncbi:hypothetical protein D3H64_05550 [Atopobacter sp. AH10]|uniref:hypothetical protein n=1 Tax=Atopobacter sp. AH10 TaxID=2315861 RepID=UPI000EF2670F|nr:hypothetical protein [Atopobacter sp. AH10]RLK63249.1 hypothetical protein D3H64_05550 [Atopobacter sp. AH10]
MEWTMIIVLLILAILCFLISLILRDNSYDDQDSEAEEALLEANREIYQLKKQIQDLEDQINPQQPLSEKELYQSTIEPEGLKIGGYDNTTDIKNDFSSTYEDLYSAEDYDSPSSNSSSTYSLNDDYTYDQTDGSSFSSATQIFHKGDFVPDEDDYYSADDSYNNYNYESNDQGPSTKDQIISLYNQGEALGTIADKLDVPVTTVQLVIDNYLEEQSVK